MYFHKTRNNDFFLSSSLSHKQNVIVCFFSKQGWKEKLGFSFVKGSKSKREEEVPKKGWKETIVEQNNEIIITV